MSFSSLLGIVRKRPLHSLRSSIRFVQNDKGLDIRGAACGARLRASAGQGCGPHGSKEPHDATTFVQKPLFRTLRCIPHSDCFTTPAAGFRFRETGDLASVGTVLACWSASSNAVGSGNAGDLWCHAGDVKPLDVSGRAYGFSVRCVQNLRLLFIFHTNTRRQSLQRALRS